MRSGCVSLGAVYLFFFLSIFTQAHASKLFSVEKINERISQKNHLMNQLGNELAVREDFVLDLRGVERLLREKASQELHDPSRLEKFIRESMPVVKRALIEHRLWSILSDLNLSEPVQVKKAYLLGENPKFLEATFHLEEELKIDPLKIPIVEVDRKVSKNHPYATAFTRMPTQDTIYPSLGFSVNLWDPLTQSYIRVVLRDIPVPIIKGAHLLPERMLEFFFGVSELVMIYQKRFYQKSRLGQLGTIVHEVFHLEDAKKNPELFTVKARRTEFLERQPRFEKQALKVVKKMNHHAYTRTWLESVVKGPAHESAEARTKRKVNYFKGALRRRFVEAEQTTEKRAYLFQAKFYVDRFGMKTLRELIKVLFGVPKVKPTQVRKFVSLSSGRHVYPRVSPLLVLGPPLLKEISEVTELPIAWSPQGKVLYQCVTDKKEHDSYVLFDFDQRTYQEKFSSGEIREGRLGVPWTYHKQNSPQVQMKYLSPLGEGVYRWKNRDPSGFDPPERLDWISDQDRYFGTCWYLPFEAPFLVK